MRDTLTINCIIRFRKARCERCGELLIEAGAEVASCVATLFRFGGLISSEGLHQVPTPEMSPLENVIATKHCGEQLIEAEAKVASCIALHWP